PVSATSAPLASAARRHALLRWIGAPLFLAGLGLLCWSIVTVVTGGAWWTIPMALLCTGLGLGAFGSNNDTALALARDVQLEMSSGQGVDALGPRLGRELERDLEKDRQEVLGLSATPKVGMILPLVCLALQVALVKVLLG
ncbi:MAG: hypothetical protein QGG40_18995, partial [Myxococcota bacterium]|nr:hypothetical protein [Myxococcota bacterium]